MKIVLRRKQAEESLSIIVSFFVLSLVLINAVEYTGIGLSVGLSSIISLISKGILLVLLLWNIKTFLSGYSRWFLALILLLVVLFIYSIIVLGVSNAVIEESISFWLGVFPMMLVIVRIKRFDLVLLGLRKTAFFIAMILPLVILLSRDNAYSYSMGLSNALVIPAAVLFYFFYENGTKWDLAAALFISGVVLFYGSRGALFSIVLYVVFLHVKNARRIKYAKRIGIVGVLILAGISMFPLLIRAFDSVLQSMGIQSRNIWLLINNLGHLSGRELIYVPLINGIINDPFNIRGVAGERIIADGAYAHNFILQFLSEFGVFFGLLCTLIVFIYTVKTLMHEKNTAEVNIKLILFAASVPRTLISGSIWSEPYLWMWFVMCMEGAMKKDAG